MLRVSSCELSLGKSRPEPRDEFDKSGLHIWLADGRIAVARIDSDSPALRAGIERGDVILSVDGRAAGAEQLNRIRRQLKGEGGTPIKIRVARGARELETSFRLKK